MKTLNTEIGRMLKDAIHGSEKSESTDWDPWITEIHRVVNANLRSIVGDRPELWAMVLAVTDCIGWVRRCSTVFGTFTAEHPH